jgi:RNA polymerase sigma-70 factor (sigma-E family)
MAVRSQPDAGAFSEFAAARSASLFRTAYLVLGDFQLAQDLVQEALVKAYVAWPRLRDVSKAEAYTRRIIVTTSVSWRRRRGFHERPSADLPDPATPDQTDRLGIHDELWARLRLLPPRQRAAVVLRYCEDLSEARTAELMGCSVGSVKRHASLGLAKLRTSSDVTAVTP